MSENIAIAAVPAGAAPSSRPMLELLPERHKRLAAGHPWVYSNEIAMTPAAKALPGGTVVTLASANGLALGTAMFNPRPLVSARLLTRAVDLAIDRDFLLGRLRRALALRELLYDRPCYRLVHAEADGLPGLIVDRFGDVVVAQLNTAGMAALQEPLVAALVELLGPRAVVLRNDSGARELEGLPSEVVVAHGAIEGPVELIENGCRFFADVIAGQKTGWFYDHRDNRAAAAAVAKGRRTLDMFAYNGGFGIQAAVAGASEVVLVDRSKPALGHILEAAAANGVSERCRTVAGEAMYLMERMAGDGDRFGLVIADPPAFVKSRKDLAVGLKAYRKMARLAAEVVEPGGFLLLASCSHNVTPEQFAGEVQAGLVRAQRGGRVLRSAGAAADHPVHPFLPESAYLKAMLLQLD